MYEVQFLTSRYFRIFQGVYEDFKQKSKTDYKFEIAPLEYNEFIEYFEKGIIKCLILLEDGIPTGFLAYSTSENLAVELFIIHTLGNDDIENKAFLLTKEFLETTKAVRAERITSYPMLGKQKQYKTKMEELGFKFVDLGVMVYDINNLDIQKELIYGKDEDLPIGFKLVPYSKEYFEGLTIALNSSFENSNDINYDERFLTISGCIDITKKITDSIYGDFLPRVSRLLLYENKVIGFCFVNLTAGKIANIPLVGIIPEFREQKLSKKMLRSSLKEIAKQCKTCELNLDELNVTVDLSNLSAYNMYKTLGFNEIYMYPQAYMPKIIANTNEKTENTDNKEEEKENEG